ncbi:hypothetical protein AwDysgo_18640 [Bacteroidales bacterium]|nr:hypothetical protein AwDysgo_18640 [Bacteroidales bacterium]
MKRILRIVPVLLLLAAMATGCYKDDINELKKDITELKERMARYENLLDALNKRLHVANYEQKDGYYIITFSDGSEVTVRDSSAFIEIGDNGNWWIDGEDTGMPAKGDSSTAPQITIGENGNWWINAEDTGVSAKGQAGADASDIISISIVDGMMTFLFADGRTITIEVAVPEITITEPLGGFIVDKLQWLRLNPEVKSNSGVIYTWKLNDEEISVEKSLVHIFAEAGTYTLTMTAKNGVGENVKNITVTVNDKTYGEWADKALDFIRAPSQYAHSVPSIPGGSTHGEAMIIINDAVKNKSLISLGGFGGYIVMGFDHTIINKPGAKDFAVNGNAFANWAEPGVIQVSWDSNGNGHADDPWYEIAGSEYYKPTALHNYTVTYYHPDTDTGKEEGKTGIRWTDNKGNMGYYPNRTSTWWPTYQTGFENTIVVSGSRYEPNYSESGIITMQPFESGYVDNWPNGNDKDFIDISMAVDSNGKPVNLKGIDFIRVHTGILRDAGALGEISTEVAGAKDLHP